MRDLIRRATKAVLGLGDRLGQLAETLAGPRAPVLIPIPVPVRDRKGNRR